ncbi:MAG: DNA internalization-related competence protein ComEC/Rec2 [Ignavibacteria bacterium]|nr:DNA internalization-related competence protein ComEC/Rec2 [Ignavibacteria bacterium]
MNNYPLIKYVLFFICGILFESIFQIPLITKIFFTSIFISCTIFSLIKKQQLQKFQIVFSLLTVFFIGAIHYSFFKNEQVKYPFELPVNKSAVAYGKITDLNLIRADRLIFYLLTDSVKIQDYTAKYKVQMICTVKDSKRRLQELYNSIKIGNDIRVVGTIARARDKRNPGEFDYEKYITEKGIHGLMIVYKTKDIMFASHNTKHIHQFVFEIRKSIDDLINYFHNESSASLLRGLILADRSLIDYDIKNEFINAGVIHVLAVSGLHVGFIAIIFVFLFKRFNPYFRYGFTIAGLILFLIITNSPTSVVRATIMALVMILSPLTGRNYNSINALSLAALIILIFSPSQIFDPGFQLSFSAVLAIVILYPPINKVIYAMNIKFSVINYILLFCAVSLAAQLGTLPFTLIYFHRLSIVSLLANIVVIPTIGLVISIGILTIVLGPILSWFGLVFGSANELLTYLLFSFVRLIGKPESSFISIQQFSVYDSILFYFFVLLVFMLWKKLSTIITKFIFAVLLCITLFLGFKLDDFELLPDNHLSVLTIDIGQGDAILIKFSNGKTALIDAGDATEYFDNGERVILPLLNFLGIEKIDYGFISHVDADHYKGFYSLIKHNRISSIYKPKLDSLENKDVELEKFISSYKIPIKYYAKSQIDFESSKLYILNDTLSGYFQSMSSNDRSGMLKVQFGESTFLFTGDAGIRAEKYYLENYVHFLESTVLKAGHHGSKTSSSQEFVDIVKPKIAIISAGILNKFKHPHFEILDRFGKSNTKILRTDKSGAVLLRSDGIKVEIINWKKLESDYIF